MHLPPLMRAACPAQRNLLDLLIIMVFSEEHKSQNSPLRNLFSFK